MYNARLSSRLNSQTCLGFMGHLQARPLTSEVAAPSKHCPLFGWSVAGVARASLTPVSRVEAAGHSSSSRSARCCRSRVWGTRRALLEASKRRVRVAEGGGSLGRL